MVPEERRPAECPLRCSESIVYIPKEEMAHALEAGWTWQSPPPTSGLLTSRDGQSSTTLCRGQSRPVPLHLVVHIAMMKSHSTSRRFLPPFSPDSLHSPRPLFFPFLPFPSPRALSSQFDGLLKNYIRPDSFEGTPKVASSAHWSPLRCFPF